MVAVEEEEFDVDWDEPSLTERSPAPAKWNGGASSRARSSATNSSYTTARLRQSTRNSDPGPGAELRQETSATATAPGAGFLQTVFNACGGLETFWFILQQTIKAVSLCVILYRSLGLLPEILDKLLDVFVAEKIWPFLQFICTVYVVRVATESALDYMRRYMWRQWRIDISPPEATHLSTNGFVVYLCLAVRIALFMWPGWYEKTGQQLEKLASLFAALRATKPEVPGPRQTI